MSSRKAIQDMLNITSGLFLGVLKRDNITQDFLSKGFAENMEEIEEWKEEIIIELYNEVVDEPVYDSMVDLSINISMEEQLGIIEHMISKGINNNALIKKRILLIRKLYNELDHVKEFNDIINGFKEEGEKQ